MSEKLENQKQPKKANTRKTRALIAATALSLNLTSCKEPTWRDIAKDKKEIEITKKQRDLAISKRKDLVNKFNQYIDDENSNPSLKDNISFQEAKAQMYDRICELNKEIDNDIKELWKEERHLYKDERKSLKTSSNMNEKMDPNAYDWATI